MSVKVIPVLDVMKGLVVHAVEGVREEYKPLVNSAVCSSPEPKCFIDKFWELGFDEIYIADLDSIMNTGENWSVIEYAVKRGFRVFADIGRKGILKNNGERLCFVIGTEYLFYPQELKLICNRVSSLDIVEREVKFANTILPIESVLNRYRELGCWPQTLLVINLKRVGTMKGFDVEIVKLVRKFYRGRLVVGGGISGIEEVKKLGEAGVDGVIIATSLHKGLIKSTYI